MDNGTRLYGFAYKATEGLARGIGDDTHAQAAGTLTSHLDCNNDVGGLCGEATTAAPPFLHTADFALIDLDFPGQQRAFRVDHGTTQFLQHCPGCLIPAQTQLALELHC